MSEERRPDFQENQSSGLHDFKLVQKLWPFMRPHKDRKSVV